MLGKREEEADQVTAPCSTGENARQADGRMNSKTANQGKEAKERRKRGGRRR